MPRIPEAPQGRAAKNLSGPAYGGTALAGPELDTAALTIKGTQNIVGAPTGAAALTEDLLLCGP